MKTREHMRRYLSILIGAILFSAAMNMLLLPAEIVLGGMTGIATVLNLFFSLPIGATILCLNVPLILLGARRFGRAFVIRTVIGVALTSAAADWLPIQPMETSPLVAAMLGGAFVGVSAGFLLSNGFSTGGTDLVALLVQNILPGFTLGSVIALADAAIILGAAALTRNGEGIAYSILCAVAAGSCTDLVMRAYK